MLIRKINVYLYRFLKDIFFSHPVTRQLVCKLVFSYRAALNPLNPQCSVEDSF